MLIWSVQTYTRWSLKATSFDKVRNWFSELDLGVKPPRNEMVLKSDMVDSLIKAAFDRLRTNHRFKNLVSRLGKILKMRWSCGCFKGILVVSGPINHS